MRTREDVEWTRWFLQPSLSNPVYLTVSSVRCVSALHLQLHAPVVLEIGTNPTYALDGKVSSHCIKSENRQSQRSCVYIFKRRLQLSRAVHSHRGRRGQNEVNIK